MPAIPGRQDSVAPSIPIFISAGEASGDLYGSLLIQAITQRIEGAQFFGCGGERMREAGCETLVDSHEITMVGLVEVVPGLPRVWRAFRRLVGTLKTRRPALAVLIDFPDFNLRLAKKLKRAGVEVVYFIAPQVWAWRKGRLKTLRHNVKRLLCIFPFEEQFFRDAGIPAEFVGHPLIGRVASSMDAARFRQVLGLPELPLIALLPGSRRKEILLNLPPMLETAQILLRQGGRTASAGFVIPAASREAGEAIRSRLPGQPDRFWVVENHTYDAVAHAEAAIVASGTATIETALLGTPMVVVYRVTRASWLLGHRLVRVPFYSMVNLVMGREIVPEFIQDRFQPETVAGEVRKLLENESARDAMRQGFRELAAKLRGPGSQDSGGGLGPADLDRAAGAIEDAIERSVAVTESVLRARVSLEGNLRTVK
jgi:lipid-A-disaccharide synthase